MIVDSRDQYQKKKCVCESTPTKNYFPYLSVSNMMSYINETTPVDRDVDKGGLKGLIYIYIPYLHNNLHPQVGEEY